MKRDVDLIRFFLLEVERLEKMPGEHFGEFNLDQKYTPDQIIFHEYLMRQAGLIQHPSCPGLTWEGHEFLDNAREPIRWEQAKALVAKAGGASVQVLLKVLVNLKENACVVLPIVDTESSSA